MWAPGLPLEMEACSVGHASGLNTIGKAIRYRAELQPHHTAVVASGFAPLSYRELQCLIDEVRGTLRRAGLGQSARIAIAMRNGPQAALAIVAVACSAVSIPLNPRQTLSEIETCLAALRPDAVLVVKGADSAARRVAERKRLSIIEATQLKDGSLGFGVTTPKMSVAATPDDSDESDTDAPAFILQTSGTSAEPKFIPTRHRNMLAAAERVRAWFDLTPQDRCLSVSPVFYAHGLHVTVFAPLLSGGTIAFPTDASKFHYAEWFGTLKPTWYSASPVVHGMVLDHIKSIGNTRDHSLRFVLSGGAPPPSYVLHELQKALGIPVVEHYGSSEGMQICSNSLPPGPSKLGTVGVPWPDTICIVGNDGGRLAAGECGEILVGGPTVVSGYLNAPELNRASFVDGWFRSGDIGSIDEDGFLALHGRKDDLINRGAEKISPVEIDDALTLHPAVAEAAAFAVPHPRLGEDIAAAVVLRPGMTATPVELREYLQGRLASFKVPRRIVIRDQLPKGDAGKVVRRRLIECLKQKAPIVTQIQVPQSIQDMSVDRSLVVQLGEIWEQLLKISPLSLDDDFFENGGDSLLATEMLVELERLTGRKIPTSILFDAPTIGQLAQKLSDSDYLNQKPKVLTRLNSSGSQTPLLYFHVDFEEGRYYAVRLARLLGPDQPLLLVAPHGIGDEPIPSSIRAMAADRLPLIRDAQPQGPYRLCGYCMGGVIAFEVARKLMSAGEQVEMVGMIDPPPVSTPNWQLQRLLKRLQRFSKMPRAQQWAAIRRKTKYLVAAGAQQSPFERFLAKLSNYVPKPLGVRVLFFSAEYDAETWQRISPDFEVIKLESDHVSVLIDPTDLAKHLKARLQSSK